MWPRHERTILSLEEDKLRRYRVFKDPLEVHGVIQLVLHLDDLLERKIIMSIAKGVEVDVAVVVTLECLNNDCLHEMFVLHLVIVNHTLFYLS